MRTPLPLACVFLAACLAAVEPIPADADQALRLIRPHYAKLTVFWSGQCPNAAKMMKTQIKTLHDLVEKHHLPAVLVCITPDMKPVALRSYAEAHGMEGAVFFYDHDNTRNISLNNIIQFGCVDSDDARFRVDPLQPDRCVEILRNKGTLRFPVEGLTDPQMIAAWWAVERGRPGAMAALVKAAERNRDPDSEVAKIHAAVEQALQAQAEALVQAEATVSTYEKLGHLLQEAGGFELPAAVERFEALERDPALKDEITAYRAYNTCYAMLGTGRSKDFERALAGFRQIAERYPDTAYGAKSAEQAGDAGE